MVFVLEFILAPILWLFKKFPKAALGILMIVAFGGTGGILMVHDIGANIVRDVCIAISGHPGCIHMPLRK